MTNNPATERVSACWVACGISANDPPTPKPPMQQDALAKRAGTILLVKMLQTSLGWTARDNVSANRNKSRLPCPVQAANIKPLTNATRIKTMVRQYVEMATPNMRGMTRCRNGSPPLASSARNSPPIFSTPSSVVMALSLRTITTRLISTGPNSRATTATNSGPSSCDCPASPAQNVSCTTTETPTKAAIAQTNQSGSIPTARICRANAVRTERTQ